MRAGHKLSLTRGGATGFCKMRGKKPYGAVEHVGRRAVGEVDQVETPKARIKPPHCLGHNCDKGATLLRNYCEIGAKLLSQGTT